MRMETELDRKNEKEVIDRLRIVLRNPHIYQFPDASLCDAISLRPREHTLMVDSLLEIRCRPYAFGKWRRVIISKSKIDALMQYAEDLRCRFVWVNRFEDRVVYWEPAVTGTDQIEVSMGGHKPDERSSQVDSRAQELVYWLEDEIWKEIPYYHA